MQGIKTFSEKKLEATDYGLYNAAAIFYLFSFTPG
jgi:hypothetical protein